MQVDERFFATLLAYTGRSHEVFRHAKLIYEDWTRATYGGHPHDWDPEEVHTGLLQYAREQHDCRGARPCDPAHTTAHDGTCLLTMLMHALMGNRHDRLGQGNPLKHSLSGGLTRMCCMQPPGTLCPWTPHGRSLTATQRRQRDGPSHRAAGRPSRGSHLSARC